MDNLATAKPREGGFGEQKTARRAIEYADLPANAREWRSGYFLTPNGAVFSTIRGRTKKLSLRIRKGYLVFDFYADGIRKSTQLHRSLCETFKEPAPFPEAVCRHLDDDRLNNDLGNLSWGTQVDNMDDALRNNRRPDPTNSRNHNIALRGSSPRAKLDADDVKAIRSRRARGERYISIARDFPISVEHVSKIVRGQAWGWLV